MNSHGSYQQPLDEAVREMTNAMEVIRLPTDTTTTGTSGNESYETAAGGADETMMFTGPIETPTRSAVLRDVHASQQQEAAQRQRQSAAAALTAQQQQQQQQPTLPPLVDQSYDTVVRAGPPADPIPFPRAAIFRGRRDDVLCYNPRTQDLETAHNVLFRDYSRDFEDGDNRVTHAYWPVPYKKPIKTIMGHVEICVVLQRCKKGSSCKDAFDDEGITKDDDNVDIDSSSDEDDEDDITFESTDELVAVKVCYARRMDELRGRHAEDPLKEIAAMQLIGNDHPNVIGCRDVLFDGQALCVVMRYCGSGDLFQLLQDSVRGDGQPGMTEPQARYWFRQVIRGVKHMHERAGICHRDLSPENVMIDGSGCLIIDMGMCLRIPYSDPTNTIAVTDRSRGTQRRMIRPQGACGKLPYMSPEIYRNKEPFDGDAADVWTCGTILFCMVTGNRSYQRPHPGDPQFYWMTKGLTQLLGDWKVQLSQEGVHLLQNMLQVDPRKRLTIDQVEQHPWFSHPDEIQDADDMEFQL